MSRLVRFCVPVILALIPCVAQPSVRAIIPVVGSVRGANGAVFKTMLQLHNRTARPASGRLLMHPAGRSASVSDPVIAYDLAPHQTIYFDDVVLEAGLTGLASLDIDVESGAVPAIICRVYDEKGDAGTTGAAIRGLKPSSALATGDTGSLIVPPDLAKFRMNMGVRSLGQGARIAIVVYDEAGIVRGNAATLVLGPDTVVQNTAASFTGVELRANESIGIEVLDGSALVYGTA